MEQVRAGVVAANGVAAVSIDNRVDVVAHGQRLLEQSLVSAHTLDGQHAALDFGDGGIAVRRGEPAGIARLAAGVAVEAGVIEDDLDRIPCGGSRNTHAVFDDGEDFAVGRVELAVAFEGGLGQFAEGGACGFLATALPTGAGAGLFGFYSRVELRVAE
jgi:hypothetical protein